MSAEYYVGPIGGLMPLPDVAGPLDAPRSRIGGAHVSLYGNRRHDSFGMTRSYSWARELLTARQVAYVDALQLGIVPGPIRLVNTREHNRLPEQAATCGSLLSSEEGWDTSSGVLNYGALAEAPAPASTLPAAPIHRGHLAWTLLAQGAAAAYPLVPATPVLDAERIELSVWGCGPTTTTLTVAWSELYADGTTHSRVGSVPVALSPLTWRKVALSAGPTPGLIAVDAVRFVASGPASAIVHLAAATVGPGGYDQLPAGAWSSDMADPSADPAGPYGGWSPGGGAPVVLVAPAGRSLTPYGTHAAALTLHDASGGL